MALQLFKIAETTVATPQTSIIFSSIPQAYTDLLLKISLRSSRNADAADIKLTFNSITTGYYEVVVYGTGTGASTMLRSNQADFRFLITSGNSSSSTINTFGNGDIYIPNYASSNKKSLIADTVQENNTTTAEAYMNVGFLDSTEVITSITLAPLASSTFWLQQSTATLYGIL